MQQTSPRRSIKDYIVVYVKGFCMGASDVVPGVSGGTMAFILGIYEELIDAIKSIDHHLLKLVFAFDLKGIFNRIPWQFLLAVGLGIMTAILSLAQGLEWMLENQPIVIWSFFFGLVLSSGVSVSRRVTVWAPDKVIAVIIAFIVAFIIVGLVPVKTPNAPWFIFLSGVIAICAMILPGISGSFILVLLNKYQYILSAVNQRDILTLVIFIAGAGIGIVTFAQLVSWLFKRNHDLTVAVLMGLMLGSLRKIWQEIMLSLEPGVVQSNIAPQVTLGLVLAIAGFAFVLLLDNLAAREARSHS